MTKRLPTLAFLIAFVFTATCYACPPAIVGGRCTRPEFRLTLI